MGERTNDMGDGRGRALAVAVLLAFLTGCGGRRRGRRTPGLDSIGDTLPLTGCDESPLADKDLRSPIEPGTYRIPAPRGRLWIHRHVSGSWTVQDGHYAKH